MLARQRSDGSFTEPDEGIGAYYKVPSLLLAGGHPRPAHRLLAWVAENHLHTDGDFRSPLRKALRGTHTRWPEYANAWLAMAAHTAGRYDISIPSLKRMIKRQSAHGGFEAVEDTGPYVEPVNTSWAGMACLATGHTAAACRAADLLCTMVSRQPDPSMLYFRMRPEGDLITHIEGTPRRAYAMDSRCANQVTYNPGIALILLASVYRATERPEYLQTCLRLTAFCDGCAEDTYRLPPSGKLGVGCALVHQISGDEAALRGAREVGGYLLQSQRPDGSWNLPDQEPYTSREDRLAAGTTLDLTAEFGVFLFAIAALL